MKSKGDLLGGLKYSSLIFLMLLFITTIIFWGFFFQELKSQKQILQSNERQHTKLLQKTIENDIKVNAYNLIFLANHTKLHKWLATRQTDHRLELISLFENLCKENETYDQIRFIDDHGMEQVRINYTNGQNRIVPENKLQNKADRYYFKETIKLNLSQVFVSPFDLNMEHGKIEHPLKPMIRFGMPVFNFDGRKMGIVLLNYLGAELINHLDSISTPGAGSAMLLNSDGFYLKGLHPEQEWGFMFQDRQNRNISSQNPGAWEKITKQEEGQFTTDNGLYSFATIRITDMGMLSSTGSDQAFKPYQNGDSNKEFYWKIVSLVPINLLDSLSRTSLLKFLPFYGLVLVIMFFISCLLGITILTRIRTQKALDQNEAELRSLFRSVPAGIGMVYNRVIIQANQQLCKMTGYSPEELLKKNARLLYPSDEDFEYVGSEKYRQIKKKGTGSVETRWKTKDGEIIDVLLSSTPVNPNNLTKGVTFSAFDITERKKAQKELAASEERHRIIIETASDGIFTISKDCKFTSLNSALETILCQKRDDWIGKTCLDLIYSEDIETAKQIFEQILSEENLIVHEFKINTDGPEKYKICEFKLNPKYDKNQVLVGIVGFVRDITEFKKVQETVKRVETQLRQSQKMEAIGTLAGGIAHDFNNILSGIFGYAQLAEMALDGPGKAKQYIGQIVKGAQRATALVQQILTFSRQTEYKKQPLMISITIKEALKLLRASLPSTIDIKENIFSKSKVMADPTQIHQVIMNLCTNAYHAMGDTGGKLTVRLQEIEILEQDSIAELNMFTGKYLKLEVSDTGHGIDEKFLERIFDPYFSTKEIGKGTGLGLAMVQAIVDEHNGFLEVDTELNIGTSFYIYLPIVENTDEPDSQSMKDTSLLRGNEKIMFIDDEEPIRLIFKDFLESFGYEVHLFADGKGALKEFEKDPGKFDLMITDMTMPGITGDILATRIMKIQPDLPIILCTGYSDKISEDEAIELGIKKYVQKPIANHDLIFLVREVLDLD